MKFYSQSQGPQTEKRVARAELAAEWGLSFGFYADPRDQTPQQLAKDVTA